MARRARHAVGAEGLNPTLSEPLADTVVIGEFCGTFAPHEPPRQSLACAGHIVNTAELALELGLPAGAALNEVLEAAAVRWPDDFAAHCNGIFVMAHQMGGTLRLYRDPSGLRNLYFHAAGDGRVSYASGIDALLTLPGVPRRIARRSLHEYLRLLDIAAPHTLYEGVTAVQAGQIVVATAQGRHALAWPASAPPCPAHFADAIDTLSELLSNAVQQRLSGARRPAAFLSGGVDSALLTALTFRERPDATALTVGFDGASFDESSSAARIAAHVGIRHEVLRFQRADYLEAFHRCARGLEQPMADPATLATLLAFEHAGAHHDVVIDGTGADEAVGSMPPRHVRFAVAYGSLVPQGLRGGLVHLLRRTPGLAGYTPLFDFEHPAETMMRWNGFSRAEIEVLCREPVSLGDAQFYRAFQHHGRHDHYERYSDLINTMPCERLNQATRLSGAALRFPFCDIGADSFLRQLPQDFRYLPTQPKRILRALLARYVAPAIWESPKHGFNFPLHHFLAADDHSLVRMHLLPWTRSELLAPDAVAALARRYISGERALLFRVWALVMLAAWLDRHPLPGKSS